MERDLYKFVLEWEWESFPPWGEEIEPEDLILVHLTNTFPEDGIIRPRYFYDPFLLRNTVHFSINFPVPPALFEYDEVTGSRRTLAILIPFDRIIERYKIESLYPTDTFILGNVELPEGSVIMGEYEKLSPYVKDKRVGKASIVYVAPERDKENGEEKELAKALLKRGFSELDSLRKAVYDQIIKMGYFPMNLDLWMEEEEKLRSLAERYGIRYGPQFGHWTEIVENLCRLKLEYSRDDPERLKDGIEYVKRFVRGEFDDDEVARKMRESIPPKYREELEKVAERYERLLHSGKVL